MGSLVIREYVAARHEHKESEVRTQKKRILTPEFLS